MTEPQRALAQALLTRAADLEAKRQAATARGDLRAQQGIEAELRRVWEAYSGLERQTA